MPMLVASILHVENLLTLLVELFFCLLRKVLMAITSARKAQQLLFEHRCRASVVVEEEICFPYGIIQIGSTDGRCN